MNPYIVLGVTPGVTLNELKRAYRRAVLRYHPDSALGKGNPEKFNAVLQAYTLLKLKYENNKNAFGSSDFSGNIKRTNSKTNSKPKKNEKEIDGQLDIITSQLPLDDLVDFIKFSDNFHVHRIAINAIIAKEHTNGFEYLIEFMRQSTPEMQQRIIRALGQKKLHQASSVLLPLIFHPNIDIAMEAIKSLERICVDNRDKVLVALWKEFEPPWYAFWDKYVKKQTGDNIPEKGKLGDILLHSQKISKKQLELSLLLQKRFPLLIGQILRHLEYLSIPEIQQAISKQKNGGFY